MKTLIIILSVIILSACGSATQHTYYTPKMRKQDGQHYCPTYQGNNPVKRKHWKTLHAWKKSKQSSPIDLEVFI